VKVAVRFRKKEQKQTEKKLPLIKAVKETRKKSCRKGESRRRTYAREAKVPSGKKRYGREKRTGDKKESIGKNSHSVPTTRKKRRSTCHAIIPENVRQKGGAGAQAIVSGMALDKKDLARNVKGQGEKASKRRKRQAKRLSGLCRGKEKTRPDASGAVLRILEKRPSHP